MRVIANLAAEFEEICTEYSNAGESGKDIITLLGLFCNEYDDCDDDTDPLYYKTYWQSFVEEHQHQLTSNMIGMIIYLIVSYWPQGQAFFTALPITDKMLYRETVSDISAEIQRRSAENSDD